MKKTGVIVLAGLAGLLLAMVIVPVAFKSSIVSKVKLMANEKLQARLDFRDAEVSLFKSFPQLNIDLKNLTINGINEFEGKTLLSVESLSTSVSLSSLWKSDGMAISEIVASNTAVNFIVTTEGKVNWDITKPSATGVTEGKKDPMKIDLQKIQLINTRLSYKDDQSKMMAEFKDGNFLLSGFLKGSDSQLDFKGNADSIRYNYGGSDMVSGLVVSGEGSLQANFDQMSFKFLNNKFLINQLPLEIQGTYVMREKDDLADLSFQSKGASLEQLIGFLPAVQQKKLKSTEKGGNLSFSGTVKGVYSDETYPALLADLKLTGGRIKYPSMLHEINRIEIDAQLSKPQGPLDSLKTSIRKIEANVAGHLIIADFEVTTPVSNPFLSGEVVGEIDFAALKQTIPLDSMEISGIARANIHFSGPVQSIEKGEYDRFQTRGELSLLDFAYRSPSFPDRLGIQSADFRFNAKDITINAMKGKLGVSDFTVDGALGDYWAYLLKKGTLNGNIRVKSGQLDITQLMNGGSASKDSTVHSDPMVVPERIDLTVQADVDRMIYNRMEIRGTTGKLTVKDQKLSLDQLSMNMLKGKLVLSGIYACQEKNPASFNFKMDIRDFDLPTAYQSVGLVRHLLPIAGNSKGTFLSGLNITGKLGRDYAPDFSALNGSGQVSMKNIELVGNNLFAEIGKYFRKDLFTNVKVNDFVSSITITNGALAIAPFTTKIANQEVTISGNQSLALDLNYQLKFKVNKNDLSADVNGLIGFVPGTENIEKYPIQVNLVGNIAKPEVKVDISEAKTLVENEFRKKAKSSVLDVAKKLGLENLFK